MHYVIKIITILLLYSKWKTSNNFTIWLVSPMQPWKDICMRCEKSWNVIGYVYTLSLLYGWKCDQLLSIYVSHPPIWGEIFSSFILLQFSHWTVEIWNLSKKYVKNERLDVHLQNFHTFDILWRISQVFYWYKSTSYWTVLLFTFKYTFRFFDNLVQALFWLFVFK